MTEIIEVDFERARAWRDRTPLEVRKDDIDEVVVKGITRWARGGYVNGKKIMGDTVIARYLTLNLRDEVFHVLVAAIPHLNTVMAKTKEEPVDPRNPRQTAIATIFSNAERALG